jgi:glycerophosphoryl diester phosphodiesterase
MIEPFLDPMPVVVAHRGDSANYPENTLEAFHSAQAMQIDVIETDVHLSKDGELVIWHDPTLERNTDGSGRIEDHTLEQLKTFDAGYTFTKDGGKTFPFRGTGVRLVTLKEALEACPGQRFNVDLKTKGKAIVDAFVKVVAEHEAEDRVLGASFHLSNLKALRAKAPRILTSLTTAEVLPLLLLQKMHLCPRSTGSQRRLVFQVPERQGPITVITENFVKTMHERGAVIQVWTINDPTEMERLFSMGVDSIMTDHPAQVIEVAERMGLRTTK